MPKTFRCADIGLPCAFETVAATREELLKQISRHAESIHSLVTLPPVLLRKIEGAIKG